MVSPVDLGKCSHVNPRHVSVVLEVFGQLADQVAAFGLSVETPQVLFRMIEQAKVASQQDVASGSVYS